MGVFNPIWTKVPEWWQAILCLLLIAAYGIIFSITYLRCKRMDGYYKDTPIVFVILPTIVTAMTMGVMAIANNLGSTQASDYAARFGRVAVALISALLVLKFRSEQRTPEVITYYLFVIALGLLVGSGYLLYSVIVFSFILLLLILITVFKFPKISKRRLTLKITIPEDLNYENAFDDIFKRYCDIYELMRIRSSDLGTLFICRYELVLKKNVKQKEFLDELRTRNSNLDIVLISDKFETRDK